MYLLTYKDSADHKGHNWWNIRDTRGSDRAKISDDMIVGEIGQPRSAQPKAKDKANPGKRR
jgi:hypothetical protein